MRIKTPQKWIDIFISCYFCKHYKKFENLWEKTCDIRLILIFYRNVSYLMAPPKEKRMESGKNVP